VRRGETLKLAWFLLVAGVVAATAAAPTNALVDNPGGKKQEDRQALSRDFPGATIAVPTGWQLDASYPAPGLHAYRTRLYPNTKGMIIFVRPPKVVFDPKQHRGVRLRTAFLDWIAKHPHLKTTSVKSLRLAGLTARAVDGQVRSADGPGSRRGFCGATFSRNPCVPLTADKDNRGYVTLSLEPRATFRFITILLPHRRQLLVQIDGGRSFIQRATKVLGTLKLK
jgi:hypothetical protein